jgi:hypothetical protein
LETSSYPTTVIAAGAYIPEEGYAALDYSMPSYRTDAADALITKPKAVDPAAEAAEDKPAFKKKSGGSKRVEQVAKNKAKKEAAKAETDRTRAALREAKSAAKE